MRTGLTNHAMKVKKLSFKVSSTDALLNNISTYASYEEIEHNNDIYLNHHEEITKHANN